MDNQNVVGWFEIYVDDMERAKRFYTNVFQYGDYLDLSDPETQMFAFPWVLKGEFASGALTKTKGMNPGKGGTVAYFNCENCAVEVSRVEKNGGKIIKPKFAIGEYGFIALVMDTEGNLIGLHSKN